MKWYIDLDDTLYRTMYGYGELCRAASQLYGIKYFSLILRLLRMRSKYDFGDGVRHSSRFFYTLRSYGIDSVEAEALLSKQLKSKDLLYPDAIIFLDWLKKKNISPTILTFGDPETQEFKMSLIPQIHHFDRVVVQQPKQHYLKNLAKHDAILIDDRPVNDLPQWCKGVLLARKPGQTNFEGRIITTLTELVDE